MPINHANYGGPYGGQSAGAQAGYQSGAAASAPTDQKPKKFVAINGVMQRNPAYDEYMARTQGQAQPSRQEQHDRTLALPIVANMDEHAAFNEASQQVSGNPRPLAESTNQTIMMMQDEEFTQNVGLASDEMVDALGEIFAKHEIPMGLMNKLMMLSEYETLEFIVDDSGSMMSTSDTKDKFGNRQTRWDEARGRLKEMVEILAYVPTNDISVIFFNRANRVNLSRNPAENPTQFIQRAYAEIDRAFNAEKPRYRTPALRTLQNSIEQNRGKSVARYFFCDGVPDGGDYEIKQIEGLIKNRTNPQQNPITFMSCSENDDVEWMKELEEVAPFAAEYDDYASERQEVIGDQGVAFPFNRGFYLIGSLVAAMNPDDLDAMDESVPFKKYTLDNLLGYQTQPEEYGRYFQEFEIAQSKKPANSAMDRVKKNQNWGQHFNEFMHTPVAKQIPVVQDFQARLKQASDGSAGVSGLTNQFSRMGGIGSAPTAPAPRYGQAGGYGQSGYAGGSSQTGQYGQNQYGQGQMGQRQGNAAPYQYQSPKGRQGFMGGMFGRRR